LPFDTATIHGIDEDNLPKDIEPADIPLHLAQTKSYAYQKPLQGNDLIITADTLVYQEQSVLGKPQNHEQACHMLRQLSGRCHKVVTGVFLRSSEEHKIASGFTDTTGCGFHTWKKKKSNITSIPTNRMTKQRLRRTRMDWIYWYRTYRRQFLQRNGISHTRLLGFSQKM